MIGRLRGTLVRCSPGAVVLDVGGVGYELQIPLSTFYELSGHRDGPVTLHVHTHVREDALQLYGFATAAERAAFVHFLAVSGVGPRLALAVLSGIGVDDLGRAVAEGDRERLQRIPGIGRKTAERLLLELRDKLGVDPVARRAGGEKVAPGAAEDALTVDARSALVNLGFSSQAAAKAVTAAREAQGSGATLERVIKDALGRLVRR